MAVIHVLDQHTAELIAAGEVVERPASVVKELLENSIDAGATQVTVELERGGISLIRISDNGSGIDTEYVPTAFIRHATSKIRTEEDLDSIHTLGFRGEALASIASVARVQLLTRTEDEEFAALYRIEGGQELGLETAARPQGTTIEVRDLFYNTPARMKFLKKDATEGTYVSEVVSRIALSHPEVAIRFVRDGKQQFATAGDGSLRSAAYAVLGREFARDLLELEPAGEGPYRLSGLLTAPRGCRASRSMQFFFINGRFVKNRTMMAALENAYKGTLMQGKFPGCVLNLEMPPQLVDVNVHPAKTEVRFAREGDVFDAVYRAVKTVVTRPAAGERVFSFAQSGATGAAKACGRAGTCPGKTGRSRGAACSPPGGSGFHRRAFCPRCRDHAADQRDVCRRKPASQPPGGGGSGNACVYRAFRAGTEPAGRGNAARRPGGTGTGGTARPAAGNAPGRTANRAAKTRPRSGRRADHDGA